MSVIIILIVILFGWTGLSSETATSTVPVARPVCVEGPSGEPCNSWETVSIDGIEGVIVAEADVAAFGVNDEPWTPTVDNVISAEQAIAEEQGDLPDHRRQYAGYIEDGDHMIFVNGFCDDFGQDWEREPIIVMDGGECFFNAVYNVDSATLEWFTFNGDA